MDQLKQVSFEDMSCDDIFFVIYGNTQVRCMRIATIELNYDGSTITANSVYLDGPNKHRLEFLFASTKVWISA